MALKFRSDVDLYASKAAQFQALVLKVLAIFSSLQQLRSFL